MDISTIHPYVVRGLRNCGGSVLLDPAPDGSWYSGGAKQNALLLLGPCKLP